jgi:ABC-type multidrug transport system fused ATPase/permease subunit
MTFTDFVLWIVRLWAANEQNMTSVERLQECEWACLSKSQFRRLTRRRSCLIHGSTDLKLEPEAIPEAKEPPAYWPTKEAKIEVEELTCAYAPELPPVLKGVSFVVQPGERVGVCGRTGEQRLLKCIKSAC